MHISRLRTSPTILVAGQLETDCAGSETPSCPVAELAVPVASPTSDAAVLERAGMALSKRDRRHVGGQPRHLDGSGPVGLGAVAELTVEIAAPTLDSSAQQRRPLLTTAHTWLPPAAMPVMRKPVPPSPVLVSARGGRNVDRISGRITDRRVHASAGPGRTTATPGAARTRDLADDSHTAGSHGSIRTGSSARAAPAAGILAGCPPVPPAPSVSAALAVSLPWPRPSPPLWPLPSRFPLAEGRQPLVSHLSRERDRGWPPPPAPSPPGAPPVPSRKSVVRSGLLASTPSEPPAPWDTSAAPSSLLPLPPPPQPTARATGANSTSVPPFIWVSSDVQRMIAGIISCFGRPRNVV